MKCLLAHFIKVTGIRWKLPLRIQARAHEDRNKPGCGPKNVFFFLLQLSDADNVDHLGWIPLEIPLNVHFIVSAVKQSRSSAILLSEQKRLQPFDIYIGELDDFVKKEIVNHALGLYNKVKIMESTSVR